jgi:hypothetical protein
MSDDARLCLLPIFTYIYMYIYIYIYALLVFYCCFTSLDICNCCNPPLLTDIHLYSCFTRTLLVLFLVCVCVCRLPGLVECVEESEGLRRDGAWEHGVLQQRPAGEAPLHDPPHVCLLIHLAAAQGNTRGKERQRVLRAAHWGRCPETEEHVTTVTQVKCRVLGG